MWHNSEQSNPFRLIAMVLLTVMIIAGCSMPNFKALEAEGDVFARDSIQKIGQSWDSKSFLERADSRLTAAGDPSPLLKVFASKLGPIKKMGEVHREDFNEFAGISTNRPDYAGLYKCKVEFQLAPATVIIGVSHNHNKWSISSFNVDGEFLKDLNKAEQTESKATVEHLAPELCKNLNVDYLKPKADAVLAAELKDGAKTLAANAMFMAISKALGKFKHCDSPVSKGFTLVQGQYVYTYTAAAQFEHGKATLSIATTKENGEWKLRSFNIRAHS